MKDADTVIIGGGVAGCSLASLLANRGRDVILLERASIGGLLREIPFDSGYYCDSAPHLLFFDAETEPEVGELFSTFTDLHHHDFYAATYPRGELSDPHHYPVSHANIDRWDDAERIRRELEAAPGRSDAAFFEEYLLDQVGETLYERYYRNYTEKHWGVSPTRITGDWFDFKIDVPDAERDFFGDGAYYPADRYSDVLERMISDCDVVFDGASRLLTDGDRIEGIETEGGNVFTAKNYVSTVDPSHLLSDAGEPPKYRSMIVLGLHARMTERLFPPHVDWGYFPNDYAFTRITDYGFTPQSIPVEEAILTVEFPCFVDDDSWSRQDSWFERYVLEFLADQGIHADVIESNVRRAPRAYPLPVTEEIEKFERLNTELASYENMYNLGRTGSYEYIWIKDIVAQAYETRDEIEASVDQRR